MQNGKLPGLFGQAVDMPDYLSITDAPVTITTSTLPKGETTKQYNQTLSAQSEIPVTWSITEGDLPTGLTLENGVIAGIPSEEGIFTFTIKAENVLDFSAVKTLSIEIIKNVGIEKVKNEDSLTVLSQNGMLHLNGLKHGEKLSVFTVAGIKVYGGFAVGTTHVLPVLQKGVYIIMTENKIIKVVLN